jgi:hypothetical protein
LLGPKKKILVSFCNLPSLRQSGVLLVDLLAQACTWIDIGAGSECVLSCTDLWTDADRIYCAWLDGGHVAQLSVLGVVWGAVDLRLEIDDVLLVAGLAPGGATRDGVRLARVVRQWPKPTES